MWLKRQSGERELSLSPLGNLETEVMERTWAREEISVRALHQELSGRLAYTTVMTTLDRLYKKGMLSRRKQGKAFLYSPAFTKVEYQARLTQHVLGIALEDSKYSNAVLSRFVDAVSATDAKMLDQLDELVKAKRRVLRRPR